MKQFEVGKTYETTVHIFYDDAGLHTIGQRFTCHTIGEDGDCWSSDCWSSDLLWAGDVGLWCVATLRELHMGLVVEVTI